MTTSPRLGFTDLVSAQAVPETSVNEIGRVIEQGANLFIVEDKDLTAPPGSPVNGDAYIVASPATGAWATHEDDIAMRVAGAWRYATPLEGTVAQVQDEQAWYFFNGTAWFSLHATDEQTWLGDTNRRFISSLGLYTASVAQALTSSASVTPDGDEGYNFSITLAHSGQLENPVNFKDGQSGLIVITQDGAGSKTWSYGTSWKFPGGAPILSTGAGSIDLLAYYVVSSTVILASLTKAYQS